MSNTNWRMAQHEHNIFTGNTPTITQPSRQRGTNDGPACIICPPTIFCLMSSTGYCSMGEKNCAPSCGAIYDPERECMSCVNITLCLLCPPCAFINFACSTKKCEC